LAPEKTAPQNGRIQLGLVISGSDQPAQGAWVERVTNKFSVSGMVVEGGREREGAPWARAAWTHIASVGHRGGLEATRHCWSAVRQSLKLRRRRTIATTYQYNVNLTLGSERVFGWILTDRNSGTLSQADIVGWSLGYTFQDTGFSLDGGKFYIAGESLTATPSGIYFNFQPT
jgi:hypothetical protein